MEEEPVKIRVDAIPPTQENLNFNPELHSFLEAHGVSTIKELKDKLLKLAEAKDYLSILANLGLKTVRYAMHIDRSMNLPSQDRADLVVCNGIVFNAITQISYNTKNTNNNRRNTNENVKTDPGFTESSPESMQDFMEAHGAEDLKDLHYIFNDLIYLKNYKGIFLIKEKSSLSHTKLVMYKIFEIFNEYKKNLDEKEVEDYFSDFNACFRIIFSYSSVVLREYSSESSKEEERHKSKDQEKQSLGIKRDPNLNYEFVVLEEPHTEKQREFPFASYEDCGSFFVFHGLRLYRDQDFICTKEFKCLNMYDRIFRVNNHGESTDGQVFLGEKSEKYGFGDTEQFLISRNTGKRIKMKGDHDTYDKIYIFGNWIVGYTKEREKIKEQHVFDQGMDFVDENVRVLKPKVKKIMELKDYLNQ